MTAEGWANETCFPDAALKAAEYTCSLCKQSLLESVLCGSECAEEKHYGGLGRRELPTQPLTFSCLKDSLHYCFGNCKPSWVTFHI